MIDMYQALQSMQSKAEGAASYALHRFEETLQTPTCIPHISVNNLVSLNGYYDW